MSVIYEDLMPRLIEGASEKSEKESNEHRMPKKENRKSFFERLVHLDPQERELVEAAYDFAKYGHRTQERKTGERYFEHPRAVALILIDEVGVVLDEDIVAAALLHDILEDTQLLTKKRIAKLFGEDVATWVALLTKERDVPYYEKLLGAPWQVLLIKCADRLHNLRTMTRHVDEAWRRKYVEETEREYPPLMKRLAEVAPQDAQEFVVCIHQMLTDVLEKEKERKRLINEGVHYVVLGQQWIESEAGWGQKPWGCTGHLSKEAAEEYIKETLEKYPLRNGDGSVKNWYVRPSWDGLFKCLVNYDAYEAIKKYGGAEIGGAREVDYYSFEVGDTVIIGSTKKGECHG